MTTKKFPTGMELPMGIEWCYAIMHNPEQVKYSADTMQFWTVEEFNTSDTAVSDKFPSHVLFNLLFWTGMRSGEVLALTLKDIDLTNRKIHIDKSYTRLNKQDIINKPKTKKSIRTIEIPPFLADLLKSYAQSVYGLKKSDRMFPYTKYFLNHEMKRGCKLSGVKKIRIHDLRHSHASLLSPKYKNKLPKPA